ncbi:MAG: hypothetical protein ABSA75_02655 [Candidatus Bathyarchaeia archaeon]
MSTSITMAGWEIEYYDEFSEIFVKLAAKLEHVFDEMNGDSYASFYVANTQANQNLVNSKPIVAFYFNGHFEYNGQLLAWEIDGKKIKVKVLDYVIVALDQAEPITGVYDQVPCFSILHDIVADLTTIGYDYAPETPVSVVFYKANRLDLVKFLAEATGTEIFTTEGYYINLGTRGNYNSNIPWNPPYIDAQEHHRITVSKSGFDYSKVADKVIIRGVDPSGYHLTGEAVVDYLKRRFE